MTKPAPHMPAIAYAVGLGCTTPKRLAAEWQIDQHHARTQLDAAADRGELRRVAVGEYALPWTMELHRNKGTI